MNSKDIKYRVHKQVVLYPHLKNIIYPHVDKAFSSCNGYSYIIDGKVHINVGRPTSISMLDIALFLEDAINEIIK